MATPNLISPSTAAPAVLCSEELPNSEASCLAATSTQAIKIATAVICNISGSAVTVSIGVVPSGDTAGSPRHVLHNVALPAGAALPLNDYLAGTWLGAGDFISGVCSAASSVVLTITGTVFD